MKKGTKMSFFSYPCSLMRMKYLKPLEDRRSQFPRKCHQRIAVVADCCRQRLQCSPLVWEICQYPTDQLGYSPSSLWKSHQWRQPSFQFVPTHGNLNFQKGFEHCYESQTFNIRDLINNTRFEVRNILSKITLKNYFKDYNAVRYKSL